MTTKQLLGRTKRARRNLALKLKLERRFKPEIKNYFNKILNNFRAVYVTTGQMIKSDSFENDTKSLLKKQYLRTSSAFKDEMRLFLEKCIYVLSKKDMKRFLEIKQQEDEGLSDEVNAALLLYINQNLPARGELIDRTTQSDMSAALQEAQSQLLDQGDSVTNESLGLLATEILRRKFASRQTTLSITETQFMAESTKLIESAVISTEGEINLTNIVSSIGTTIIAGNKNWASILDGKTRTGRFNHVESDGQRVSINQAFIVSGQRLMFPGDSSLGASIGNTINCRCSSLYSL